METKPFLFIGNSSYEEAGYANLAGVHGDATLWQRRASQLGRDIFAIMNGSLADVRKLDMNQFSLVIYSGHGVQLRKGSSLAEGLAFVGGQRLDVLWDNEIDELQGAEGPLWFIDCCHAAGLGDKPRLAAPWGESRSSLPTVARRGLDEVTLDDVVSGPSATRAIANNLRLVSTARKFEKAIEVRKDSTVVGLGTLALHQLTEQRLRRADGSDAGGLTQTDMRERMAALGGRRASQPSELHWAELEDLIYASEPTSHVV